MVLRQETLPLGVVLERRAVDHPWRDHEWRPVAVIPGAPQLDPRGDWRLLEGEEGGPRARYHAGTLPIELFRKETEAYKFNLAQDPPRIFVVLRGGEDMDCDHEVVPFLVTVSPYEAQDYLDCDDLVEPVVMPEGVIAFVQAYVDAHHVDEPFKKRKRDKARGGDASFARPPGELPRRRGDGLDNG